jgi:phosphoglycolate phosphatase
MRVAGTSAAPRYALIVFDWDGTLADSTQAIALSIQAACVDMGCPAPSLDAARHVIGLGLREAMAYLVPGLPTSDYDQMIQRYRAHWLPRDPQVALFPGSVAMLAQLAERGHMLAIATGKSSAGLRRALHATGVADFFAATRCADQCASKPAPDMLQELMQELATLPKHTLMVGDTTHDLQMARHAGVDALAICHGAHARDNLVALEPLACLDDTAQLAQWLQSHAA